MLLVAALPAVAQVINRNDIDGEHGVLYVYGALTTSACRLEMVSAQQIVEVGTFPTGQLLHPGDAGQAVPVIFRLADCISVPSATRDKQNGNMTRSVDEPSVSLRFSALTDADNPSLIGIKGASGFGLKLTSRQGPPVRLNEFDRPHFLVPGQDSLEYILTPVRTRAFMRPGAWHALINVGFSYD